MSEVDPTKEYDIMNDPCSMVSTKALILKIERAMIGELKKVIQYHRKKNCKANLHFRCGTYKSQLVIARAFRVKWL